MKAIVIGAGVGGLAVANMLARLGYEVDLYEKNDYLGGRMGKLRKDGFSFDTGPSWYLMPEVFEHYFSLFDKKTQDYYSLKRLNPAYKVFYDYSKPIIIRGDINKDSETFESIEPGSGIQLRNYVAESKEIYKLALKYFLYNPFRSFFNIIFKTEILLKSVKLIKGLIAPLHNHVIRTFKTQKLQQILEYGMVFLGTSPFKAPSLYRLMSYLDFEQGVFFPNGGMYKVSEALISLGKEYKVKYHTNSSVDNIVVSDGIATGIKVNNKIIKADLVISGADLAFTEMNLVPNEFQTYPKSYWDRKQAAPSAILLFLGISGELPELEHHNLFFVKNWKENFKEIYEDKQWPNKASMYVSKTSASDKTVAPRGYENVFVLIPLPPGKDLDPSTQSSLAEKYLEQLEDLSGVKNFRQRIVSMEVRGPSDFSKDLNSWQGSALGMSHTLLQSAFMRPKVKSQKIDNLYYVGGMTQPGIGVPMCLISAELVVKSLINDVSPGPLSQLRSLGKTKL